MGPAEPKVLQRQFSPFFYFFCTIACAAYLAAPSVVAASLPDQVMLSRSSPTGLVGFLSRTILCCGAIAAVYTWCLSCVWTSVR